MAQWKRVYVPGKGYRWTDGKGNYKTNNPSFRNPANAAVDAGALAAKSTAKSAASTASKSASATAKAASRTAENERNASSNAIGYAARKRVEEQASKAPKKSNLKGVSSTNDIARLRREQEAARQEQLNKANRKPPTPKPPAPTPAGTQPSRPAASRPSTPASPKKPAAPASPKDRRVSAATANRESGNYGTSRTNNPMIDDAMKARMRQREERQAGASGSSKPEDKSKYVASDGRQYKGPAFGNDAKSSNTASSKNKPAEKGMTLAERMRKRRQGLA